MQAKFGDSVIIEGYIAKPAEAKRTQNGRNYTNFSASIGNREVGGKKETIWVSCTAWGELGRYVEGLKKGDRVLCIGKVNTYTGSDGNTYKNLNCESIYICPLSNYTKQSPPPQQQEFSENSDDLFENEKPLPF